MVGARMKAANEAPAEGEGKHHKDEKCDTK